MAKAKPQTFSPAEAKSIDMQLPKNVSVAPMAFTKGQNIEIVVEIDNEMSAETFERLKKANRYAVVGVKKGNSYVISMPNLDKKMKINGVEVSENITLRVSANANYELNKKNSITFAGKDKKATFNNNITVSLRLADSQKATINAKAPIKPSGKHGDILIDDVIIDPF
jgi:hypothetical protein